MGALSLSSSLLRHFLPPKPPSLPPNLLFKQSHPPSFSPTPLHTLFRSLSSSSQTNCQAPIASLTLETPENVVIKDDSELNSKETQVVEAAKEAVGEVDWDSSEKYQELVANLPSLSTKEKKELASYAHSLGKKLKSQQVGKGGVTDAVATALVETLEANELLKVYMYISYKSYIIILIIVILMIYWYLVICLVVMLLMCCGGIRSVDFGFLG